MIVSERYQPLTVGVNSTVVINKNSIGGFLCQVGGTITITNSTGSVTYINVFPVTAGVYYPIPIYLNHNTSWFTTASGASGYVMQ